MNLVAPRLVSTQGPPELVQYLLNIVLKLLVKLVHMSSEKSGVSLRKDKGPVHHYLEACPGLLRESSLSESMSGSSAFPFHIDKVATPLPAYHACKKQARKVSFMRFLPRGPANAFVPVPMKTQAVYLRS